MKISNLKISAFILATALFFSQGCVEVDSLATPLVESPVLVLLEGTVFPVSSPVTVNSTFLELDKTHILDHTKGIDSIPVSNLNIRVLINNTLEISSITTNNFGKAEFTATWAELGLTNASVGNQVRLEFVGEHKNVAFRKYHDVRVN